MKFATDKSLKESLANLPSEIQENKKSQIELLIKMGTPNPKSEDFTYINTNLLNLYSGQPVNEPVSDSEKWLRKTTSVTESSFRKKFKREFCISGVAELSVAPWKIKLQRLFLPEWITMLLSYLRFLLEPEFTVKLSI